jgi:hypothetical protein
MNSSAQPAKTLSKVLTIAEAQSHRLDHSDPVPIRSQH